MELLLTFFENLYSRLLAISRYEIYFQMLAAVHHHDKPKQSLLSKPQKTI